MHRNGHDRLPGLGEDLHQKVNGQPTLSFDQPPKSGGNTFVASKDGNIWFKVVVPQSEKDEPYASCCDIEFDYLNE